MFSSKKQKTITYLIFGVYIILLVWLILFKFGIHIDEIVHNRSLNLIPFKESTIINGHINF